MVLKPVQLILQSMSDMSIGCIQGGATRASVSYPAGARIHHFVVVSCTNVYCSWLSSEGVTGAFVIFIYLIHPLPKISLSVRVQCPSMRVYAQQTPANTLSTG